MRFLLLGCMIVFAGGVLALVFGGRERKTKLRVIALLRQRRQRLLWTKPLWIVAVGLGAMLGLTYAHAEAALRAEVVIAAVAVALAVRWWRPVNLRDVAQQLDAKTDARNRFETVAQQGDRDDPLAHAVEVNAEEFIARRPLPQTYGWFAGAVAIAVLTVINLDALRAPTPVEVVAEVPRPKAVKARVTTKDTAATEEATPTSPKPIPEVPPAALRWVSPAAEISASAKEEIPLTAEAESKTGLREIRLHVAVNGEDRAPLAVVDEIGDGTRPLAVSLLLETLRVEPYDVVTYFLRAERIRSKDLANDAVWPAVSSTLQMVQIRSLGEATVAQADSEEPSEQWLRSVQELKQAQFAVAQETFELGNQTQAKSDPDWAEVVHATEAKQNAVGQRMAGATPAMTKAGLSPEANEAWKQAQEETLKATAALGRAEPGAAVNPAARALSKLAAVEKEAARLARENRARLAAKAAESGVKEDLAGLPARETTAAGRLEKLAARESALAEQLAARTAGDGAFKEQDQVAREALGLAGERKFSDDVNESIKAAAAAGTEAKGQLNEQDPAAATEPAARAAQSLQEAVTTMESAGRARASDELLSAQMSMLRAATEVQSASPGDYRQAAQSAAQRLADTQRELSAAARRQQQTGSAEAAQKLEAMSKAIRESDLTKELTEASRQKEPSNPVQQQQQQEAAGRKLTDLAQRAADDAGALGDREKMRERAAEDLNRVLANLQRLSGRGEGPLQWIQPTREITAQATETVALVAEANPIDGLAQLTLRLTVNGDARPGQAVAVPAGTGRQAIPVSLALSALKLKVGDVVSYQLTAERTSPTVPGRAGKKEILSTRIQMLAIPEPEKPSRPNDGASAEAKRRPPEETARVIAFQKAQRAIVERLAALERETTPKPDAAWLGAVKGLGADERQLGKDVQAFLVHYLAEMKEANPNEEAQTESTMAKLLDEAQMEMARAAGELQKSQVGAATPPAIRALAALIKVLTPDKGSGKGFTGGAGGADEGLGFGPSGGNKGQGAEGGGEGGGGAGGAQAGGAGGGGGEQGGGGGGAGAGGGGGGAQAGGGGGGGGQQGGGSGQQAGGQPGGGGRGGALGGGGGDGVTEGLNLGAYGNGRYVGEGARLGPAANYNPNAKDATELQDLYLRAAAGIQVLPPSLQPEQVVGGARHLPPPPPGPGRGPRAQRDFANLLSQQVSGLLRLAPEKGSGKQRVQVLTTANPSEAPPVYRPAVADYFESLAKDRTTPVAPPPPPKKP